MAGRLSGDPSDREIFPSKRDWWVTAIVWALVVGLAWVTSQIAFSPIHFWAKIPFLLANLISIVLGLWILYGTNYALTGDSLVARCGPFRSVLPLAGIQEVIFTNNPMASPACSLDRLHLRCVGSDLLISPLDKNAFIMALASRCADVQVRKEA